MDYKKIGEISWEYVAPLMGDIFGVFVDMEERFFHCPDCDEPILEEDYSVFDVVEDEDGDEYVMCPVCEEVWEIF